MTGDDDDILNIDLEDLDDAQTGGGARPASGGSTPSSPAPPPGSASVPPLPMVRSGICAHCGFALRPLEDRCPRCLRLSTAPSSSAAPARVPEAPAARTPPAPPEPVLPLAPRSFPWAVVVVFLLVASLVGGGLALLLSPRVRARAAYREGLRRQLASDFAGAREQYELCLRLDPTFALAAFSMGTTYIGLGDPALIQSVESLVADAVRGDTQALDEADRWFREAIRIGNSLPADQRLMDERISTPRRLAGYARACLALTALIRASAAMQADQLDDGLAWLRRAGEEAQGALLDDPGNSAADRVLRMVMPRL